MGKKHWRKATAEEPNEEHVTTPVLLEKAEPAKEERKHHEGDRPPLHRKHPFSRAFEG